MRFVKILAGSVALVLAACASDPPLQTTPHLTVVAGTELPPPHREDLTGVDRDYIIGPLDKVSVEVFGLPDFSRTLLVDGNGRISLPLVGPVQASGATSLELAQRVETLLRQAHVRNPQVSVNLVEMVSQFVTIDGE